MTNECITRYEGMTGAPLRMIFANVGRRYFNRGASKRTQSIAGANHEGQLRQTSKGKDMTMRQTAFAVFVLSVSTAAQAAAPTEHRHVQAKQHIPIHEQWRNSSAFIAPAGVSPQSEAAMTSGIAGH